MPLPPLYLYGGPKPFIPPPWIPTNDTLRGGSSTSSLTPSTTHKNGVVFSGHLDTQTLGGAGFAAQFSPTEDADPARWDLTGYEGMEVTIGGKGDGKVYTLVLKDDAASGPDDGYWLGEDIQSGNANGNQRREASLSWEAGFDITKGEKNGDGEKGDVLNVWLPWKDFKATYRGQPIEGAGGWKGGRVTRVGFMMRSYFGSQQGDFHLEILALCAK